MIKGVEKKTTQRFNSRINSNEAAAVDKHSVAVSCDDTSR